MKTKEAEGTKPTLRDLIPAPKLITIGGVEIALRPMSWFDAAEAFEVLSPVLANMPAVNGSVDAVDRMVPFVAANRVEVAEFLGVATKLSVDDICECLQPMQMAELMLAVFEINTDFFVQSLPAAVATLKGRLEGLMDRLDPVLAKTLEAASSAYTNSSSG